MNSLDQILLESREALELSGVLEEVAAYAFSEAGKFAILSAEPLSEIAEVQHLLDTVAQLKEYSGLNGPIGLNGLLPMEGIFGKLENPAAILEPEEFLVVQEVLSISDSVKSRLDRVPDRYSNIQELTLEIEYLTDLRNYITKILDETGQIRPTASITLQKIHGRTNSARAGLKKRLEKIVNDRDLQRIVQEDYITMRNDRYVILLRPEFKGVLEGIVHDHSRSGASVYVEPFSVIELNNQIATLLDEEREEIRRILVEATNLLRSSRDRVLNNYYKLVRIDELQARALYAAHTNSIPPIIRDKGFRIIGGRHPLLFAEGVAVVPMDILQDENTSITVISGANMGGKTVALKIAGLFPLLTRCGILLPAQEGTEICLFRRIMADIGDDQDIRNKTSTFSGHMMRIRNICENAKEGDLVLLDELGGATDPEEGSALAMAIMDFLAQQSSRVIVTTHFTHLKAYAISRTYIKNVSVEFHATTLKPTFRLLYDLPGESHAIITAERIGLPAKIIENAKLYLDKSAGGSSQLIANLREKIEQVEEERQSINIRSQALKQELDSVNEQKQLLLDEFRKEAREMLSKAQHDITELKKNLKQRREKTKLPQSEITLDQIKQEIASKLGSIRKSSVLPEIGSRVFLKRFQKYGTVTDVLDNNKVEILLGSLTVVADTDDLKLESNSQSHMKKNPSKNHQIGVDMSPTSPQWQVRVIGMRVDEAIPIVEKAIDHALLSGLNNLQIIHGKGTGRLRKAIWDYLSNNKLVRSFQSGDVAIGGSGITIVEMVQE
jgi:DNA mismatch repair protein MutS2